MDTASNDGYSALPPNRTRRYTKDAIRDGRIALIRSLMKKFFVTLVMGLITSTSSLAKDASGSRVWSGFYDRQTLAQVAENLRPGIIDNWRNVIWPALSHEERQRLKYISFVTEPEVVGGPQKPDSALNFFAVSNKVHIPASSTRMLGDLVASWMWLNQNNHSTDTINEYLAILKYQWASGALRKARYRPLEALGVPANVRDDPAIAGDYARVTSNALFFIIGHELGHILYNHPDFETRDGAIPPQSSALSIAQEQQADAFALELMRRIGGMPVGVPLLFMFTAALEAAPGDPGYGNPQTHPQSSERIRALVDALRSQARGFARRFNDPATAVSKINAIADQLINDVASSLESPVVRDLWRQKGLTGRLEDLKPRAKKANLAAAPEHNGSQSYQPSTPAPSRSNDSESPYREDKMCTRGLCDGVIVNPVYQ